jgi:hypothetical protein
MTLQGLALQRCILKRIVAMEQEGFLKAKFVTFDPTPLSWRQTSTCQELRIEFFQERSRWEIERSSPGMTGRWMIPAASKLDR